MRRVRARARADGFTLLELLVVLAIAGLLVALVPPVISAVLPGVQLKSATLEFAATLREARNRAVSRGTVIDVVIRTDESSYAIAGETPASLTADVNVGVSDGNPFTTMQLPANKALLDDRFILRFYPDGSSSGVRVEIKNARSSFQIDVGWLMGNVTVARGAEHAY